MTETDRGPLVPLHELVITSGIPDRQWRLAIQSGALPAYGGVGRPGYRIHQADADKWVAEWKAANKTEVRK